MTKKKIETQSEEKLEPRCLTEAEMRIIENNGNQIILKEKNIAIEKLKLNIQKLEMEKQEAYIGLLSQDKQNMISKSKEYIEKLKKEFNVSGSFGYDPITGEVIL